MAHKQAVNTTLTYYKLTKLINWQTVDKEQHCIHLQSFHLCKYSLIFTSEVLIIGFKKNNEIKAEKKVCKDMVELG